MNGMKRLPPQMVKRMSLFLLWLIKRHEMHGYQMLKLLKSEKIPAAASRLYPMLNHMLAGGLISQKEKKTGRRVRKVYVVAAKGRKALAEGKKMFKGLMGQFFREMLQ